MLVARDEKRSVLYLNVFTSKKDQKSLLQRLQDFAKDTGHVRHAADSVGAGVALVQGRRNSIFYKWHQLLQGYLGSV